MKDVKKWNETYKYFQKVVNESKGKTLIAIYNKKDLKEENKELDSKLFKKYVNIQQIETCLNDSNDSKNIIELILKISRNLRIQKASLKSNELAIDIESNNSQKTLNIVLLGPGEVGKSTIIRQLRMQNKLHFNENEIENFKNVAAANVFVGLQKIFKKLQNTGNWEPTDSKFVDEILNLDDNQIIHASEFIENYEEQIKYIYQYDVMFQEIVSNHHKHLLHEGFPYLIKHLDDILDDEIGKQGKNANAMILRLF
jgi:hypothetical protein